MKASCPEVVGGSFVGCQQEATQDGLLGLQVVRWRRDFLAAAGSHLPSQRLRLVSR